MTGTSGATLSLNTELVVGAMDQAGMGFSQANAFLLGADMNTPLYPHPTTPVGPSYVLSTPMYLPSPARYYGERQRGLYARLRGWG